MCVRVWVIVFVYVCVIVFMCLCVCVCACVRACLRACVLACLRACVCVSGSLLISFYVDIYCVLLKFKPKMTDDLFLRSYGLKYLKNCSLKD